MTDRPQSKRLPILTGYASRRAHGVRAELERRAETARQTAREAESRREVEFAAAMRGKARGLHEAAQLVAALENGGRIGRRRRNYLGATP